jgi:hypothetical protein
MDEAIHECLGCNITATPTQLMGIASLIKETSGKNICVADSTHCINKAMLCSGGNVVDHISEEILNSLDEHIKVSVDPTPYWASAKICSPMEFYAISQMFLFKD